jgi:thiol-disulfide isomerase/thioredoxin
MSLEIGSPDTFDAQIAQPGLVVAYFWGPDCPNCEVFARDLPVLLEALPSGVKVVKTNAYEHPELARRFDVMDEGWKVSPLGYFDKKLLVRMPDGMVGEIQIWPPGILDAKKQGGTDLYNSWRSVDPAAADADQVRAQHLEASRAHYGAAMNAVSPAWSTFYRDLLGGGSGKGHGNWGHAGRPGERGGSA